VNRVWTLCRKDLLETRRDRLSAIFIVIMPIAFTTFFGLMFGGGSDRLPLALHDADGGPQARQLTAALERSDALRVVRRTAGEFEPWLADGRAPAGLLIPEGFSAAVERGETAELVIVSGSASSAAQAAAAEVRAAAGRLVAASQAARIGAEAAAATDEPAGQGGGATDGVPPMAMTVAASVLDDPAVSLEVVTAGGAAGQIPTGFVLSSPG
jgi:ABC-type Na+ efflux pump permease subunit